MSVDSSKEGQEWYNADGYHLARIGSDTMYTTGDAAGILNALESAARNAEARIREMEARSRNLLRATESVCHDGWDMIPEWRDLDALLSPSTGEKAAGEVGE